MFSSIQLLDEAVLSIFTQTALPLYLTSDVLSIQMVYNSCPHPHLLNSIKDNSGLGICPNYLANSIYCIMKENSTWIQKNKKQKQRKCGRPISEANDLFAKSHISSCLFISYPVILYISYYVAWYVITLYLTVPYQILTYHMVLFCIIDYCVV